ncbi:DUF308 domain-containing protein [Nocardia panacis]|uniref:DUF308 domain-containing protein n=1 Tax=Nocardia panacis TaxID=2340916 RepID=A0A3A4KI17_9NOCA|nr:DUF308 domain-containing protein [Nocardia panacis]RJO73323.1 DUF308 domain-containing protein [Nocardia panacis]
MPADEEDTTVPALGAGARQAILVTGVCSIALGVIFAAWPNKSVAIAELLTGLYLLLSGTVQMIVGAVARIAWPLRIEVFASGVLSAAMSVLCLREVNSVLLLDIWLGLGWLTRGIGHATVAAWSENIPRAGKHELFGLFTMALGIAVILLEVDSLTQLGLVAGVCMIVLGALEVLAMTAARDGVGMPGAMLPWRRPAQ